MPSIKTWFAVSQDINRDPDIRELRKEHGDKAVLVWLELLSIAVRHEGYVPGRLSPICDSIGSMIGLRPLTVAHIVGWLSARRLITYHNGGGLNRSRYITKWLKYNKTRKSMKSQVGIDERAQDIQDIQDIKIESKTLSSESGKISVSDFCDSWNEYFDGKLPKIRLPLTAGREKKLRLRLRDHPGLAFWQEVFKSVWASDFLMGRNGSDWRASFDWLIDNDKNSLKVVEGNYVNKD